MDTEAEPDGTSTLLATIAKYEEADRHLTDLVRDAHAAAKDLRAVVRDARDAIEHGEQVRSGIESAVRDAVAANIEQEVQVQLAELAVQTKAAMDSSVDRVGAKFDELADMMLNADGEGPSLVQLIEQRKAREQEAARRLPRLPGLGGIG